MLTLPDKHRSLFREPFGKLYPDIPAALPEISGRRLFTVGDVVTHNLVKSGIVPALAIIDGNTRRSPCKKAVPVTGRHIRVANPAGMITDELVAAIRDALSNPPSTIEVAGEEDLAVIPLVIEAPEGSVVLYGQPDRGVVVRPVDPEAKATAKKLLARFIPA